jgi:hypothetical protein
MWRHALWLSGSGRITGTAAGEQALGGIPVVGHVDRQRIRGVDVQRPAVLAVNVAETLDGLPPAAVDGAVAGLGAPGILSPRHPRSLGKEWPQHSVVDAHHVVG